MQVLQMQIFYESIKLGSGIMCTAAFTGQNILMDIRMQDFIFKLHFNIYHRILNNFLVNT